MNTLILGDCLKEMVNSHVTVDMILCDPPFQVTKNPKDIALPFRKMWEGFNKVIKENGCIALFAQGLFYVDLVNSNRSMFRYDLVWDKVLTTGFLNAKRCPLRVHEQIAIFYKKTPVYNPQFTEGQPLHGRGTAYKEQPIKNQNYGKFEVTEDVRAGSTQKYPTSVVRFKKPHPASSVHPTEKSVDLCRWLIRTYTNPGDTVLDNCMGSGTTGVAAVLEDRNFIGIEIDPEHFKVAKKRVKEAEDANRR